MTTIETYPKEVNWPGYTATLRTVRVIHPCAECHQSIHFNKKTYVITMWNAGLAGKKFPDYCCPSCLAAYRARTEQ